MLNAVRVIFLVLAGLIGFFIGFQVHGGDPQVAWKYLAGGVSIAMFALVLERAFARRFISMISVLMFGILTGFILGHLVISALYLIPIMREIFLDPQHQDIQIYLEFSIIFFFSFLAVIAILHTKDELKFVIPFVDLKQEGQTGRPMLLDTSVIIDGRIADVVETRIIDNPIIIPRFVLHELQQVADSADKNKRSRGRRGLDILHRMQKNTPSRIEIQEVILPGVDGADAKLLKMAANLRARIVTNDFNLNKVARVQNIEVININDLANAMKPQVHQGDHLRIKILKPGESEGQGVGYLEDGTMVVAEDCAKKVGQEVRLVVTNVLQTSAGRLIFGRPSLGDTSQPS